MPTLVIAEMLAGWPAGRAGRQTAHPLKCVDWSVDLMDD
jgi:hypothetical protein